MLFLSKRQRYKDHLKSTEGDGQESQEVTHLVVFSNMAAWTSTSWSVVSLHHMQTMSHHASCVCPSLHPDEDPLQPVTSDETVSAGGTVTLTCRVAENDNSSLQWSNTAQQTLYFGEKRGKMKHTDE